MSKSLGNVIDPNDIIDGIEQQKMIDRINESQLEPKEKGNMRFFLSNIMK